MPPPKSNAPKQARASLPAKGELNPSPDGSPLRARPLAQEGTSRRRWEEEEGWSCGGREGGLVWIGVGTRRRGKPPGISWRLVRSRGSIEPNGPARFAGGSSLERSLVWEHSLEIFVFFKKMDKSSKLFLGIYYNFLNHLRPKFQI